MVPLSIVKHVPRASTQTPLHWLQDEKELQKVEKPKGKVPSGGVVHVFLCDRRRSSAHTIRKSGFKNGKETGPSYPRVRDRFITGFWQKMTRNVCTHATVVRRRRRRFTRLWMGAEKGREPRKPCCSGQQ